MMPLSPLSSFFARAARPAPWRQLAGATALLGLLAGCDMVGNDDAPPSEVAAALQEALPEDVFEGTLAGQPTHLLVHDCKLYRIEHGADGALAWTRLLTPEPYPFTACERQSIRFEKGALTVVLGRRAFGSGGCCATGGRYRSTDGVHWKEQ